MRYAFFPGCVLEGAAKEAHTATVRVAAALGIELIELDGWACCGASHMQDVDEISALAVNARNIALAEKLRLPLLTVCNTCTLMLRQAKQALDRGQQDRINAMLAGAGLKYAGTSEITHLLWVLVKDHGLETLRAKVIRPLTGLKVAPYYGCHILRPPAIMDFEDHANPGSLEALITALGAQPVAYSRRLKCCGFHSSFTAQPDVLTMTGQINRDAVAEGAHCTVTPCPLCQMQLDMYQPEGRKAVNSDSKNPVLHLSQLVGLALGIPARELGMHRHITSTTELSGWVSVQP